MTKFAKIGVLLVAIFGVFALCRADSIDDMLRDTALVERQIRCLLDQGPCDAIGTSVKNSVKAILNNECRRCNQRQLDNANRVSSFVAQRYPREWAAIVAKYQKPNARRF